MREIIGSKAPNFQAQALVKGEKMSVSLEDFKGKKIALYFYPRDMTPGCTRQACNLRDHFEILKDKNIIIIGVSTDPLSSHKKFAEKKELPFILVSDTEKEIVKKYGVWGEKKFMGKTFMGTKRTTFLINEDGTIVGIIEKPDVKSHSKEILETFTL